MGRATERWPVAIATLVFLCVPFETWGQKEWTWKDGSWANAVRTRAELEKILKEHKAWVESGGSWTSDPPNPRGTRADLTGADLSGANLFGADLSYANLRYAELKDAFVAAKLTNANFEPRSIPEARGIALASGLESLTYGQNPDALVQLRKQFEESGFRAQERKITYALNRRRSQLDGPPERWFSNVAFDLACQYGMNPGRPLRIWLALLILCWFVYAVLIHLPGESGIYRVEKQGGRADGVQTEEQIRPRPIPPTPWWLYPSRMVYEELRVLFWAGFFSLMSAFNIGFREINFGGWLRLLPRTEYDLKAKGWARTVAGFQSLVSVYMIALWVLTYFGRPFE